MGQQPMAPYAAKKPGGGLSVGAWVGIGGGGVAAIVLIVIAIVMMGGSSDKKEDETQVAGGGDQPVTTPVDDGKSNDTNKASGSKKNPSFKFPSAKKFSPGTGSKQKKKFTPRPLGGNNSSTKSKSGTPNTKNNSSSSNNNSSSNTSAAKKSGKPAKLGADFSEALKRAKNRIAQAEKREKQRASRNKTNGSDSKGPSLAAGPTLAVWKAKVDPSKETVEFATGRISINLEKHQSIHFPVSPSRFVLVLYRDGKDHLWTVYDLQTAKGKTTAKDAFGRPVTGQDLPRLRLPTLSPNGKFLVSKIHNPDTKKYVFRVWSFETGIMLQDIPVGEKSNTDQAYFAGGDSLVTIGSPDYYSVKLSVTNLADGKKGKSFTIKGTRKEPYLKKSIAVSHGGKYVALAMGQKLVVRDLATGDNVGEAPIPEPVRDCHGIAFSNNGEKLAALFRAESGAYLLMWDFRNGEVLVERPYEDKLPYYRYDGPELTWMPDDSGLIFRGHIMADAQTGLEVWNFPKTTKDARKIIKRGDKMDMLVVLRQKQVTNLSTTLLPTTDIASTIKAVRATGSLLDASLPPSTTPNLISARQVSMPSGNVDWSVVPDDPGAPQRISERDIVGINEGGSPKRLMISPPHSAKAIVYSLPKQKARSGRKTMKMMHLQSVDLRTGRAGSVLDTPSIYQLIGVSPSGNKALLGIKGKKNGFSRIDIVSFEPKKHVAAWRPYEGENSKDAKHKAIKEVTWGALLTEDLVGTVNASGKFIAWKLPNCEAAYIIEDFGRPVAASPSGKYLVGAKNAKLYVFETATGACKGELESPSVNIDSIRAAFHPRGKHLAALVRGRLDRACIMWDLSTGKIERQFPVPEIVANFHDSSFRYWAGQTGSIAWRGDKHLVTDFGHLINVESQCLVWHYMIVNRNYSLNSPDGRHWQLGRKDFRGPYMFQAIDMPSDKVKRDEDFIKLQDQLVLYPGAAVRLDVRLSAGAQKVSSSQVATAIAAKLKERGIEVSDAAPITLSVTSKQGTTGTTIEVSKNRFPSFGFNFGRGRRPTPGAKTFQQKKMVCVMTLMDSSNKVVWKREATVAMRSYGSVKKESAQSDLTKEMHSNFSRMVSDGSVLDRYMATFVFKDPDVLVGDRRSLISDKGEGEYVKPDPNKRQPNRTGTRSPFNRGPRRPSFRPPRIRSPFR